MATLPRALPQSFHGLRFCFRENKFKTAASASFRGVDFLCDYSRSASAVTRGASAKAFCTGCMDICCLYLLVGRAFWDNVFGYMLLFDRNVCASRHYIYIRYL